MDGVGAGVDMRSQVATTVAVDTIAVDRQFIMSWAAS
jgi:hypothetical protein